MRKGTRSRSLKAGKILLTGGGVIDCTLRDISPSGARLRIATPSPLPQRFDLLVPSSRTVTRAELRWQRGREAGVAFLGAPRTIDPD
jgi:hypothetical protein